jgi:hypothetical protein
VIDVDDILRAEFARLVAVDARPDWDEVVERAGLRRDRGRRRWVVAFAAVLAAVALGVATPLGSAIANGLGDFSAWVTGQPGAPASEEEQRAFEEAQARSWLGFPEGTKLRRLTEQPVGDVHVRLFGFRLSSSTLCLRVTVAGAVRSTTVNCAPLAELRRDGSPARVVMIDHGFGRGDKVAWYGIDRVRSTKLQVTAGIAADGVESVVLEDDAGRHEVPAVSNAFLYVAPAPEVGQRVRRIWARTQSGLVPVSFAPLPFGFGPGTTDAPVPTAPAVEREVHGGRIGWLEAREPRGESLDVLPPRERRVVFGRPGASNVRFGRVLTPDPGRPLRLVMTLNAHRPGGAVAGLCTTLIMRGVLSGGCTPYPEVFDRSQIPSGMSGGGSSEFVSVHGFASDNVARVEALLSDGQRAEVPIKDSAFVVDLPRANLPARLVAYDSEGHVIEATSPFRDFGRRPAPARGRATLLLRASGPNGSHAELFVGPSNEGGECMFVKYFRDRRNTGVLGGCMGRSWRGEPVQLSSNSQPPVFIAGRVRSDVRSVRVRFANGDAATLTPTRGFVLYAVPAGHRTEATAAVAAEGLGSDGAVVGRISFRPPGG